MSVKSVSYRGDNEKDCGKNRGHDGCERDEKIKTTSIEGVLVQKKEI